MVPVVGFYTKDTPYEEEAQGMQASAILHGVEKVVLFFIKSAGNWVQNCGQKPTVLIQACLELQQPFLYVDADARFQSHPHLFDLDWTHYDIGVHYFKETELLSGTIYVNPKPRTIQLLSSWEDMTKINPGRWDQKNLNDVINADWTYKVLRLPSEYAFIYDKSKQHYGHIENPVIVHYQASRKYKKTIL
jgi:hypothetical protein